MRWTWKGSYDKTQPLRPAVDRALHEAVHAGVTRVAQLMGVSYKRAARAVEQAGGMRAGAVRRVLQGKGEPRKGEGLAQIHKGIEAAEKRATPKQGKAPK